MRDYMQTIINDMNSKDTIVLKGIANDVHKLIQNYSILVMTSLYEGLPMVLLEAQSAGLPILAYAFPCGPKDVVTSGVDGYVVTNGDANEFVKAAIKLMSDEEMRKSMGKFAYKNSRRFHVDEIMKQWIDLFDSLV